MTVSTTGGIASKSHHTAKAAPGRTATEVLWANREIAQPTLFDIEPTGRSCEHLTHCAGVRGDPGYLCAVA